MRQVIALLVAAVAVLAGAVEVSAPAHHASVAGGFEWGSIRG